MVFRPCVGKRPVLIGMSKDESIVYRLSLRIEDRNKTIQAMGRELRAAKRQNQRLAGRIEELERDSEQPRRSNAAPAMEVARNGTGKGART